MKIYLNAIEENQETNVNDNDINKKCKRHLPL